MLIEGYTGAPYSRILADLEELYKYSKKISQLKNTIQEERFNHFEGLIRGTLEAITILADYYIEEFDKGISQLKKEAPSKFLMDRLHDISTEATQLNYLLEEHNQSWYTATKELQEVYNKFYDYTNDLHHLYLLYEEIENRYFFGNYNKVRDEKEGQAIVKSGNYIVFGDKKIELNTNSREFRIISFLFDKAPDRRVDYDEIEEFYDSNSTLISEDKSSNYHACRRLQNKVSKEFRIEEFLDYDTKSVQLKNLS